VSRPEGTDCGADNQTGSSEYRRLLPPRQVKETSRRYIAWTASRRACSRSDAGAHAGTNKSVAEAMFVFHQADDADIPSLNGLLAILFLQGDRVFSAADEQTQVFRVCLDNLDPPSGLKCAQIGP
jgi:hypothetical protein